MKVIRFNKNVGVLGKRQLGIMFGFGLAVAYSILMSIIFFVAYFNGFTAKINVNAVGEAHYEAVIVPVTLFVIVICFIYYVRDMKVKDC